MKYKIYEANDVTALDGQCVAIVNGYAEAERTFNKLVYDAGDGIVRFLHWGPQHFTADYGSWSHFYGLRPLDDAEKIS